MLDPESLRSAEAHLRRRDKRLAKVIDATGPCLLGTRERDPFHVLCTSIISQQLSTKAADTIQARVAVLVASAGPTAAVGQFAPHHFVAAEHEQLRGAGLSKAKASWLITIAQRVHQGEFSFAELNAMDDEAAIEALDALPGIGRWTAEMFLMFAMDRLDIFAMGDVGLRRGINQLYNKGEKLDDDATLKIVRRWAPYRSIASWYLWRLLDGNPQNWA